MHECKQPRIPFRKRQGKDSFKNNCIKTKMKALWQLDNKFRSKLPGSKAKRENENRAQGEKQLQGANLKYLFSDLKTKSKDKYYTSKF